LTVVLARCCDPPRMGAPTPPETSRVAGFTATGFDAVRDAFGGLGFDGVDGGAFAAFRDGKPLVDLWGGGAGRRGRAWQRDTAATIFSGTKGLVAMVMLSLVEDGRLDPDAPVVDYWPEFAAHGKEAITITDVVTHTAGLPFIEERIGIEDILNARHMAALLADQAPLWTPPCPLAYHAMTFGWLCDELVRRACGESISRVLAERFCRPLHLDLWLGAPREAMSRVADLSLAPGRERETARHPRAARTYDNPPLFAEPLIWNLPRIRRAELPAGGAIGTARDIARLYGELVRGERASLLGPETVAFGRRPRVHGNDAMYGDELAFAFGWELQATDAFFGPDPEAFGHTGAGGSVHGAWPEASIGFSFVMSELRDEQVDDRARTLLRALWDAL
jgi:CubicO group peptidase (beta-lactamase class C family)